MDPFSVDVAGERVAIDADAHRLLLAGLEPSDGEPDEAKRLALRRARIELHDGLPASIRPGSQPHRDLSPVGFSR